MEGLFQEGEEDGEDDAEEGDDVVPVDGLSLEDEGDDDGEDGQGDDLLDDLELDEVEGTAVLGITYAVGRDREAVLEEGDAPGEQDDQYERPARGDFHFAEFQMPVPGERHEDVRADKHQYGPNALHVLADLFPGRKVTSFP